MSPGDPSVPSAAARNRAERRAADRKRRRRKGLAAVTGASVVVSGLGIFTATPAGAADFEVSNGDDAGPGSLRQAIIDANGSAGPDRITFDPEVTEIILTSGVLLVTEDLTIDGPGMDELVITTEYAEEEGYNAGERFFYLDSSADSVTFEGVTISGARVSAPGAAIRAGDVDLTLDDVRLDDNQSPTSSGGGVYLYALTHDADVTITGSVFEDNTADSNGGALVAKTSGTVSVSDSEFVRNEAYTDGGALYLRLYDGGEFDVSTDTNFGYNVAQSAGAIFIRGGDADVTVDDATFLENDANQGRGGALLISLYADDSGTGSAITVTDSRFERNSARDGGGGAFVDLYADDDAPASVTVTGTTFDTNDASSDGGGLQLDFHGGDNELRSATLDDLTFVNNYAYGDGGGLAVDLGDIALESSGLTLDDNEANVDAEGARGGGAFLELYDGSATIDGLEATGNDALRGGGFGVEARGALVTVSGAIVNGANAAREGGGAYLAALYGGEIVLRGSTVAGNDADDGGGLAIDVRDGTATVEGSTISGNVASGSGGGVLVEEHQGEVVVDTVTVSGNESGANGGGIAAHVGSLSVRSSTITANSAVGTGGGVVALSATDSDGPTSTSAVWLANSIVSGNTASDGVDVGTNDVVEGDGDPYDAAEVGGDYTLIGDLDEDDDGLDFSADGNLIDTDPLLDDLADNGGDTLTHLPGSSSPVRDAGDPDAENLPDDDQRGEDRVVNSRVDIGAVELAAAATTTSPVVGGTTPPTTTPPTTTPPTTTPPTPPTAPGGGGTAPVFVDDQGEVIQVPLPPSAPPNQVASSVAVSRTESIAVTGDGQIFSTNPAHDHGGIPDDLELNGPIVGLGLHWTLQDTSGAEFSAAAMEWVPSGYWLLGADGGVFSFGSARFLGSTGATKLNRPVVAITPTSTGDGYWLLASDGGVFTFGDAVFHGSTGSLTLAKPVVALLPTASGKGYWLIAADGGVFAFGDARFLGSASQSGRTITGAVRSATGEGYVLLEADGTRHPFTG